MKKELKKLENKNMQLTVELDAKEWEALVNEAYNKNKGKYKVEGFRKGKAPRKIIEKMYGTEIFYEDAITEGFNRVYMEVLSKDKSFEPIDGPEITIPRLDDKGITIVAEIPVMPEVKLGAYKGLKISTKAKAITEKDVEAELKRVQEQNARLVEKDKAVENGDIANIDFKGSIDGNYFEGGTAEGFDLTIGSHSFIDNFEDQLVGLKAGDKKDVIVTFPSDYQAEDLAGKEAKFECVVNSVKVRELPEINDALASDVSEFETLDEYKAHFKEHLAHHAEEDARVATENKILDKIVETSEVEVPEIMVTRELDAIMQDMEYRLMYQGATMDMYCQYLNTTVEKLREERKADALKSVKLRLALQEIMKAEKFDVTGKEIDEYVENMAKRMGKPVDEYKKNMSSERLNHIGNEILMKKMLDFLVENNK